MHRNRIREARLDVRATVRGVQIPGERQQVAPPTVDQEVLGGPAHVASFEGGTESGQPAPGDVTRLRDGGVDG